MYRIRKVILSVLLFFCIGLCACATPTETIDSVGEVPDFAGEPYIELNDNVPDFVPEDYDTTAFESYSELDALGRCGTAFANIGTELMPTTERGEIGMIKPSGWQTVKYDFVDGKYLYNRCHLIAYQLAGENANEKNLITGTRYMNVQGMLPFETEVADYVKTTKNHVLYRVTPIYEGDNLVASGVQMEAWSQEDDGAGICFNVYVYNVEPGVCIDYANGDNWLDEPQDSEVMSGDITYVINTNTGKFHHPDCASVDTIKESNKQLYDGNRENLIGQGYQPCGRCHP